MRFLSTFNQNLFEAVDYYRSIDKRLAVRFLDAVENRALVCYAAPAFHRVAELNANTVRGTIIEQSTFPLATRLNGHSKFYYNAPGGSGVANPEPEGIDGYGLERLLANAGLNAALAVNETRTTELEVLATDIETAISERVPDGNPRKATFVQRLRELQDMAIEFDEVGPSGRAFLRVASFAIAFNLDWYAVVIKT
jgi:hypothetical protein